MPKKVVVQKKSVPVLADLMNEDKPFSQCGYQAMALFNQNFGAMSTAIIGFLFVMFKDGTPDYPIGITTEFAGDENDPRILLFMNALSEYETQHKNIHDHIFKFIALYMSQLEIPIENFAPKEHAEVSESKRSFKDKAKTKSKTAKSKGSGTKESKTKSKETKTKEIQPTPSSHEGNEQES